MSNRLDSLPKWAQNRIRNAEEARDEAQSELAAALDGMQVDSGVVQIRDEVRGHITLPMRTRVRFKMDVEDEASWVEVCLSISQENRPMVQIRGERSLAVLPLTSNTLGVRPFNFAEQHAFAIDKKSPTTLLSED